MTEQEFLALEPREQDAVVAEKVMGKIVCLCHEPLQAFGHVEHCFSCHKNTAKRHTTDISAAWEVVEKMRSDGFWVGLDSLVDTPDDKWRAEVRAVGELWKTTYAASVTAPLAICIAALKAVGEIR